MVKNSTNLVLAALAAPLRELLSRSLQPIELPQGKLLHEQGAEIDRIYFPDEGMISYVGITTHGAALEVAMLGRDGVVGGAAALGPEEASCRATVQIRGSGTFMAAPVLRDIADKAPELRRALISSEQTVLRQAVQSAVCVATHDIKARLARWLLRCRDVTGSDELALTHEYIAEMLAVRRASVSVAANELQQRELIRYAHGRVRIIDPKGLHEQACECYEVQKD